MAKLLNKTYPYIFTRRRRLIFAIWGAVGFFLFILFFQPFGIEQRDFNNYILLIAGFGGIAFLTYSLVHIPVPWHNLMLKPGQRKLNALLIFELLIWILNTVAFSFYLRFVAHIGLSIFMVFRIALITLFQLVINMLLYELNDLRQKAETGDQPRAMEPISSSPKDITLIFTALSGTDKLKIRVSDLLLLRSAENYVEFHYLKEGKLEKKLLRNTLKKIEEYLAPHESFIRCHRNSIVNINYVRKLHRSSDGFRLELEEYSDKISVSRQYLLQVKKALEEIN